MSDVKKAEAVETTDVVVVDNKDDIEVVESQLLIDLSKEYTFEGEKYSKVDLRSLYDITGADMIAVNRQLSRNGNVDFLQEMTLEYAFYLAARATKLPVEFFKGLPPKDSIRVKNRITGFLFGSE